ncbi:MAG: hypothetical protein RML72_02885 [Bacteroidia bacterium]|nr:hypothetical protein [Bacteroidia bacterium]MDW8157806.1 hypothetical protein [Bacteroidia bacterium]
MKRIFFSSFVFCLFCLLSLSLCIAQTEDENPSSFKGKQKEMLALIEKQKPRLAEMTQKVEAYHKRVLQFDELLKIPKNVKIYRDSAQKALVNIRKSNDAVLRELHALYFEWFPYTRHLSSVYTRYGEMKAKNITEESLTAFLIAHREIIASIEHISKKIKDIYNDCDFLLNAKLE